MPMAVARKVLIVGYYGFRNMGDEAVLTSMVADLRAKAADVEITVVSDNPAETSDWYRVQSVHWRDSSELMRVMAETDLVLLGGGGLFNSYLDYEGDRLCTQAHSLFAVFVFSIPVLAYLLEKPCVIYGVGASHILSPEAREHARFAVDLSSACTVRDPGSKEILVALGADPNHIRVTADPAFRLQNASAEWARDLLGELGVPPERPLIGVVLRNWSFYGSGDRTEEEVADALRAISEKHDATLLFIPFDTNQSLGELSDDLTVIDRVIRRLGNNGRAFVLGHQLRPHQISAVVAQCRVVLGMRLHSVILSIRNGVPPVGLVYDPKVRNIMEWAGLGAYALDLERLSAAQITSLVEQVLAERGDLVGEIRKVAQRLYEQAAANADHAWDYVGVTPAINLRPEVTAFVRRLALKQTRMLIDLEKQTMIRELSSALRQYLERGQPEAGMQAARDLLALQPENAEWHYMLAYTLHQTHGDLDEALREYDQAEALGFAPFWISYNRGALHLLMGNLVSARQDLQRATSLDPNHEGAKSILRQVPS